MISLFLSQLLQFYCVVVVVIAIIAILAAILLPAKSSELSDPSQTIMFGDSALESGGKLAENYSLEAPYGYPYTSDSWNPTPTMHFRHAGQVSICWADGHADFNGPVTYSGGGAANFGWFGGKKAAEVMKLFKLSKNK